MKYFLGFLLIFILILFVSCDTTKNNAYEKLASENQMLRDSLAFYTEQTPNKLEAIVELSNMNIVYRGVNNPIKILVPHAKRISVMAPGLRYTGNGIFNLRPTTGKEVTFQIVAEMYSGKQLRFEKVFQIQDIRGGRAFFDDELFQELPLLLSKEEILESHVSFDIENYVPVKRQKVKSFTVLFPKNHKIPVEGSQFSEEAKRALSTVQVGDTIHIVNIQAPHTKGLRLCKIPPLSIEVIEE